MTTAAPLFGIPREGGRGPRTVSFAAGLALNTAVVAVALALHFPAALPRALGAVVLIAPAPPATARHIPPPPARTPPARHFLPPAAPPRAHLVLAAPPALPRVMTSVPAAATPPAVKPAIVAPRPVITGVFSAPESMRPTAAVNHVQTAAFPGTSFSAAPADRRTPAPVDEGSFGAAGDGAPVRSGLGDRRLSAEAFGSVPNSAPPRNRGAVSDTTVFDAASASSHGRYHVQTRPAIVSAVRILAKPKPKYTEEARRLRIEGEVWIEILFGADGTVRVQRITRTLGHGLDESAVAAAREIRFRPANDGSSDVDQIATIRVQFLLAD